MGDYEVFKQILEISQIYNYSCDDDRKEIILDTKSLIGFTFPQGDYVTIEDDGFVKVFFSLKELTDKEKIESYPENYEALLYAICKDDEITVSDALEEFSLIKRKSAVC